MQLIAYYSVYNEADFIQQSLLSVCPKVDKTIIIEGAWRETYLVNGHRRSNDGTCDIIKSFINANPQYDIEYHELNEDTQLKQRTAVFGLLPKDDPYLLWLVDGDEVYEEAQAKAVAFAAQNYGIGEGSWPKVYTFESLIFINDFYNYSPVRYPRLFLIEPCGECDSYEFIEPNHIARNGLPLNDNKKDADIRFFHYSYCHSPERFQEKKRERTRIHGNFAWELRDGLVSRDDATILPFDGDHPEVMNDHPLVGKRRHKEVSKKETIVYVEHSGIGNLILSTPMLQAIRKAKPDANIHVICWNRSRRIIEGADYIDTVVSVEDKYPLSQFHDGIDHLLISPVGVYPGLLRVINNFAKHIHNINVQPPWTQHESEAKMQLARKLGYRGPMPKCNVPYFEYNRHSAILALPYYMDDKCKDPAPVKWVALAAGYLKNDHWSKKHWGNHKYAELIKGLNKEFPELGFVLIGSDEDRDDAQNIISLSGIKNNIVINRCGYSSDIKDTAAILSGSVLSIGNDGGLQHVAAAVGTPTVTIFTFTNPVKNRPFYGDLTEKCGKIVLQACEKRLMCQHGGHVSCECLDVPTDEVLQKSMSILREIL